MDEWGKVLKDGYNIEIGSKGNMLPFSGPAIIREIQVNK